MKKLPIFEQRTVHLKLNQNQRKAISLSIKILIFFATLYYIYAKVFKNGSLNESLSDLVIGIESLWMLAAILLLMFFNWSIEASKWKLLISTFEKISFKRSFAAVWSGLTINNWVPYRMAEFAGRVLFISAENRGKAIVSTFAGSLAQMGMTLIFGSLGLLLFYDLAAYWSWLLPCILGSAIVVFFFFYFRMRWFVSIIRRIRFLHFLLKYVDILEQFSFIMLFKLILLSLIRYLAYVSQYVLLLILFGIELNVMQLYFGASLIFLIQTFIPSVMLTDLGVRGATVLYVFEKFTPNVAGLLVAASSLWLINLLIPSFFGALFILLKKKNNQAT